MGKRASKQHLLHTVLIGGFALVSCTQSPKTASITANVTGKESLEKLASHEEAFLGKINELRKQVGVRPLEVKRELQRSAAKHSEYMNIADKLSHIEGYPGSNAYSSDDRISLEVEHAHTDDFFITGENIACGSGSAEGVFQQWVHSKGHYDNMVSSKFQFIGIARAGTEQEAKDKRCPYYWTTDFGGNPPDSKQ